MMEKYIVLRDLQADTIGDPFGTTRAGLGPRVLEAPPEPAVEVAELNRREHADLLRDQTVIAITPVMRTRLTRGKRRSRASIAAPAAASISR